MRDWKELSSTNIFQEMITKWNQNIDSSRFLDKMTGTILSNGVLFEGKETIDGMLIRPLTKVELSGQVQSDTVLDNFKLYFRDTNKVIELDRFPIDLLSYCDGKVHFLFIREDLSYRISDYMFGYADEILLFRFVINTNETWNHLYIMAQRAGTPMYNAGDEFYNVEGMYVKSPGGLELSQTSGTVKRSGIDFTDKVSPDISSFYNLATERVPIRYINTKNEIDYSQNVTYNIITNKYMTYNLDKQKKIQAEKQIQSITNLYYMIEEYSNSVAQELHDSIVSGGEQADLRQIVDAYVDYINIIYGEVDSLYTLLGDSALSSVRRADLLTNKNTVSSYITANLISPTTISESQVNAIRTIPCYIVNINPAICNNPLEFILQSIQDDLDDIDFSAGVISDVTSGKFTIQRILWDVYEKCLIIQYGNEVYDTFDDAVIGTGLLSYPAPYGKTIYIPLAILLVKSGISSINDDTETLIIDRRWVEVDQELTGYIDYVSRAYAKKALERIQEIIDGTIVVGKANSLKYTNNGQVLYEDGDFYLDYTNLRNKLVAINNLTTSTHDSLKVLSAYQGYVLDTKKLDNAGGTLTGTLNSQSIIPTTTDIYDLGSSTKRWNNFYANSASINNITIGGDISRSDGGVFVYSKDNSVLNVRASSNSSMASDINKTLLFSW